MQRSIPIVTVDGPVGSGKGSIGVMLAKHLGYHLLDSGALYRVLALSISQHNIDINSKRLILELAKSLNIKFIEKEQGQPAAIILDGKDVSDQLRLEQCGELASKISQYQEIRDALYDLQRSFLQSPGLVADGRDMGTIVFKEARVKFYLTASQEERAWRRYQQLLARGLDVDLDSILLDVQARDARDMNRAVAPLKPASDAVIIDSTGLNIEQVFDKMLKVIAENNR